MTKEQLQEHRADLATNAHGLERGVQLELIDECERLATDLTNSRADALKMRGLLAELRDERAAVIAFLRKLDMRHVAAAIQDGKHLEAT